MNDGTYISMQIELLTYMCAGMSICVALIILNQFLIIKQNKKIMNNQERLDAANEKTTAAIAGIGRDLQAFIQEVKDAQGGSVSEEAIARAEANANSLAGLDAQKDETVAEEPEAQEKTEDPTAPGTGGEETTTEQAI